MKKFKTLTILALCAITILTGCQTKLASGGAYAPTAADGTAAPDLVFYQTDSAFDLVHAVFDFAFKAERENRAYLWKLSPNIKHTLDKLRPDALKVVADYTIAREAYQANPSPPGLSTLQGLLARAKQISAAVSAVLPSTLQLQPKGTL